MGMAHIEVQQSATGAHDRSAAQPVIAETVAPDQQSPWSVLRWLIPLALLHGLLYLAIVPPWQNYDEPTHFAYVRLFVSESVQTEPVVSDLAAGREIADSMYRFYFWASPYQPDLLMPLAPNIGADQTVHPPLYYTLAALPVRAVPYLAVETQLYAARAVALVLYVLTVVVAWRLSVVVMPGQPVMHVVVPLILMLVPAYSALMSAVNNDVLVNFSAATLFLGCAWLIRDGLRPVPLLLAVLGLLVGLFAKRTALVGVIPFGLALFWSVYRRPVPWWGWVMGFLGMGLLVGVVGFQYDPSAGFVAGLRMRSWLATLDQSYLRLQIESTLQSLGDWEGSRQVYLQLLQLVFFSFWLRMGWGHVHIGAPGDALILGIVVLSTAGLLLQGARLRRTLPLWQQRCILLFSVATVFALLAAVVRVHPLPPPGDWVYIPRGRYLHIVLLPIIWLLVLGIQGVVPQRWRVAALMGLLLCFVLLDTIAWAVTLTSYYYR